jgi:hypothetical protein
VKLIFLHGLPGVGKLTVARALAELTGFRVFHNHLVVDLVEAVFDFGSPPFIALREQIWTDVFTQAAEANLDGLIFTFAFDRTVRDSFINDTRKIVESSGGDVLFIELKCSTEELERRIEDSSRRGTGKLSSVATFRQLQDAGAFVEPGIPANRLVIDTTELSALDAARLVLSHLVSSS